MSLFESIKDALTPHETKSVTVSYRVTPSLKKVLKDYAKSQGMTMQELIDNALLTYFKNKKAEQEKSENC